MAENFNSAQVYQTLKIILSILRKYQVKHWFMGSIIPTALNGSLYRTVNDLDILINIDDPKPIIKKLMKLGYQRKTKNIYRVSEQLGVFTFEHPNLLEAGFFVAKDEGKDYSITAGFAQIRVPKQKLPQTNYKFQDLQFTGIPAGAAYTLSLLNKDNPKRQKELVLFKTLKIKPVKWPLYDFCLFGIKANWAIDLLDYALVIVGKLRVKFGKPYDPWR